MMETNHTKNRPARRRPNPDSAAVYQICVEGRLEPKWADWFEGFTLTCDGDTTLLTGVVVDQAGLHGLLGRLRDLNLPLISLQRMK